jgi:hypothetical protein
MQERNGKLWILDDEDQDIEVPAKFEVCERCNGHGKHVNPSIDGNGITGSELAELQHEDPNFLDDYTQGVYDVTCYECKGKRVVLQPDWDRLRGDPKLKKQVQEWLDCEAEMAAEQAAELRMQEAMSGRY